MGKKKETKNVWFVNFALRVAGGIHYRKLVKASKNPRRASEQTLRGILTYAKDSVYGREHHFEDILRAKDDTELYRLWQQHVHPNDYEDMRPYVERHKQGEAGVLFPGKPRLYATTSGTTSEPKWIPITEHYLKAVYGKMTKVWLYEFLKNRPKCFEGGMLTIVGKVIEGYAPDGTVFGSVSGVTQRDAPGFVKALYTNPPEVFMISDYNARYYTLMRMAIERDVHVIITANPSTVAEVLKNANRFFDEYIEDIERGTLSAKVEIEPEIRAAIAPYLKPNPERAAELRALKAQHGNVLPKHYWPDIQILTTWKCGNTKVYLEQFKDAFPSTMLHQEFAYFSSECRFGLVLDDTNNTVLFPHYHYYEFVAEEECLEPDFQKKPDLHFLQLHELQKGKRYCPFVTTYAGLYRYCMNDLVEASDLFHQTPTVFMVQKINGIVTMTGEKLHEQQFMKAVRQAADDLKMPVRFFIGFAELATSSYQFYYEFEDEAVTQADCDRFTVRVDEILKQINMEYEAKRVSLRVKDPVGHRLQRNSFEQFKARCIAEGARDGQFKLMLLMQDEGRHAKFKDLTVGE